MEVHLVARRPDLAGLLTYHLGPMGMNLHAHTDPLEVILAPEGQEPEVVLWYAPDHPRAWKAALAHLRYFGARRKSVFVILAPEGLEPEEAAKATHLDVNGIVTEDVTTRAGATRLIDLLGRYRSLQDKRSFTRYVVGDFDHVGLAFVHPGGRALVTGQVTEVSLKGMSFQPDRVERIADLRVGTDLPTCSLRAGEHIVSVTCRIMRSGRDLGLQFLTFEEGAHELLRTYIPERPGRALKAALESRKAEPAPGPAAPAEAVAADA